MLSQNSKISSQAILLNFQELISECVLHTNPDEDYYAVKQNGDFHYFTQILFPVMNGIISFENDPQAIYAKCDQLKNRFKNKNYPLTWIWPHDSDLPELVEAAFNKQGFHSLGKYTSVAAEAERIRTLNIKINKNTAITRVERTDQFEAFMQISREVYGIASESLSAMTRLFSAYKATDKIKLYLAEVNSTPAATLLSFRDKDTLGLYNAATLESYRKQGLLTHLMIHAVKNEPEVEYTVAQLMAAQNARGVCDKLGFKEYGHFIPLCYGFNLESLTA